jgi:hypothetical protein
MLRAVCRLEVRYKHVRNLRYHGLLRHKTPPRHGAGDSAGPAVSIIVVVIPMITISAFMIVIIIPISPARPAGPFSEDLVNRSMAERNNEQIAIRPGMNISADTEASAKQQALALRDLKLRQVIRHTVP